MVVPAAHNLLKTAYPAFSLRPFFLLYSDKKKRVLCFGHDNTQPEEYKLSPIKDFILELAFKWDPIPSNYFSNLARMWLIPKLVILPLPRRLPRQIFYFTLSCTYKSHHHLPSRTPPGYVKSSRLVYLSSSHFFLSSSSFLYTWDERRWFFPLCLPACLPAFPLNIEQETMAFPI